MVQEMPETFGRYRILKPLGEGAMGTVYLARDTQLDRLVALKVPKLQQGVASQPERLRLDRTRPQFDREASDDQEEETPDSQTLERFFREARAAAALNHPNICAIHDIGEIGGIAFLTMSYLEGRTLADMVDRDGPMDQRQASTIVCTLARAMQEAHSRGVIHRDLKPSNVMMTGPERPVIMDFGIARREEGSEARLTKTGAILGTPAFMAPEQIEGDPDAVGRSCDIYSLGVILYELLTARLPFGGPVMAMLGKILHEPPEPPSQHRPGLDGTLEAVCLRAMAKRPQDRYPTMADFASSLEEYLRRVRDTQAAEHASEAGTRAAPGSPPGFWTRSKVLVAGGVVCGGSVLAGFFMLDNSFTLTAHPTPARSVPPRRNQRENRSATATETKSLPSSTSISTPGSASGVPERSKSAAEDPRSLVQAKPRATSDQVTSPLPAPPPSRPAATPPALAAGPARPRSGELPLTLTDSIGIKLILIPAGTFTMGSAEGEGEPDEHPLHQIRISRPFYMGVHELTQGQYRAVVGNNPSWFSVETGGKEVTKGSHHDEQPVESVTWFEAVQFCNELSKREGLKPFYTILGPDVSVSDWTETGYRLPTEAEWEYACRAGNQSRYSFGNNERDLIRHAWFGEAFEKGTHPVARKQANPWGLFDMHGNVGEWCWDWYDRTYYNSASRTDPKGAARGNYRVSRGGGFDHPVGNMYTADRTAKAPTARYGGLGFRVARNSSGSTGG